MHRLIIFFPTFLNALNYQQVHVFYILTPAPPIIETENIFKSRMQYSCAYLLFSSENKLCYQCFLIIRLLSWNIFWVYNQAHKRLIVSSRKIQKLQLGRINYKCIVITNTKSLLNSEFSYNWNYKEISIFGCMRRTPALNRGSW